MIHHPTHRLSVELHSGLLLGGTGVRERGDHTLRRPTGEPFIPASALKGALREQLTRIAGALGHPEMVEAIFGGAGTLEANAKQANRIFLSDADLCDEALRKRFQKGLGYVERTQVAIDRRSRRSSHQRLFNREVIAPFAQGLRFETLLDASGLNEEELLYLQAAARAVYAIGAGRSGGLGFVTFELQPISTDPGETQDRSKGFQSLANQSLPLTVELTLEAKEPLCIGASRFDGTIDNVHPTLDFIPASALRGAVATAALAARGITADQTREPWFYDLLFDPERCLRFGDALPIEKDQPKTPRFAPFTLRRVKGGREQGVADTLVRGYLLARLAEKGIFLAPHDEGRLVPLRGLHEAAEPERRVVTRLALESRGARAAHGQLFSLELIERGTRFVARVGGVGEEGLRLLEDAARRGLRVGHGRGQGYGAVAFVGVRSTGADTPIVERLERFDQQVRDILECAGTPDADGHFFALTLASDALLPAEGDWVAEAALVEALGLPAAASAQAVFGQVRTGRRGGFATFQGEPKSFSPVLRAGSVVLVRVALPLGDLVPLLARHEDRGLGLRIEEGFGWVRFSDAIHLQWRLE